jgi:hypothetical protein
MLSLRRKWDPLLFLSRLDTSKSLLVDDDPWTPRRVLPEESTLKSLEEWRMAHE